jgi:Tol biopolymer transport system component
MFKLFICLWLSLILLGGRALAAQVNRPLIGPLVALVTPQQDRILLYDLGTNASHPNRRELSFGTQDHFVWGFSPDGCRLLFTLSEGMALPRFYSARLDGSDLRDLVQYTDLPPESWGVWEPQWSPDGMKIAFTMIRDQPKRSGGTQRTYHIAWVDPQGGEPQFYSKTGDEHSPQWSPDGKWLAYISYQQRLAGADVFSTAVPTLQPPPGQAAAPVTLLNEADLWVVSADGSAKLDLTDFPTGSVSDPRWSPDGELISFIYSPSANNDTFWMIANQKGAIPTQLSTQWVQVVDTTWMPDSTAIVAAVRNYRNTAQNRLWTIPLVGNADNDASLYPAVGDDLLHADYARFSADGHWLAVRTAYDLAILDTGDHHVMLLGSEALGNTPPVWSPAGFRGERVCQA